ncbi:OmpA family protein [Geoalkalibacter sp.]|uniref:OmpA family protein n=1 Tax=Geoalkalibacter sp. TaxID=3041440 RepID=UPI00272E2806|nr:OmpA family protein [Geoalkalibacter sp.]
MARPSLRYVLLTSLLCLLALAGCGTPPPKIDPIPLTKNPSEQIDLLAADLTTARVNEMHVLAPDSFAAATQALESAREGQRQGWSVAEVLHRVALGRAYLDRGKDRSKVVQTMLAMPLEARALAQKAGAVKFGQDYLVLEDRMLELNRAVENERIDWALRRSNALTEDFRAIELRAIKQDALGEARDLMQQARGFKAETFAPQTLQRAARALDEAENYITDNRYEVEQIRKKSAHATFETRRLLNLTQHSRSVKEMPSEQIVLWIEELLVEPAKQFQGADWRDKTFPDQAKTLSQAIEQLQAGQEAQRFQIEAAQQQIGEEQAAKELYIWEQRAAKEKLERERQLQQLFREVQASFSADEAEVYKQGNHVILRLRSIHFPVGQAVIQPANYPVLGKVRQAIQRFGEPAVTIEGHTDSTGSDETNARLSQQRAEAVRHFFVANGTLPAEKILAVGYGSRRPLALNTTPEGRAVNRRIDVIISPQMHNGN